MKIVKRQEKSGIEFHKVPVGRVFEVHDKVYMKVETFHTNVQTSHNAVNLATGQMAYVNTTIRVEALPDSELKLQ